MCMLTAVVYHMVTQWNVWCVECCGTVVLRCVFGVKATDSSGGGT